MFISALLNCWNRRWDIRSLTIFHLTYFRDTAQEDTNFDFGYHYLVLLLLMNVRSVVMATYSSPTSAILLIYSFQIPIVNVKIAYTDQNT